MAGLIANVEVGGVWYGPSYPGAEVTPEVAAKIPNPKAWEGGEVPETDPADEDGSVQRDGEPPRFGKGSSTDTWREHAESLGIDVPDGAKQGEIVALVDAHHATDE